MGLKRRGLLYGARASVAFVELCQLGGIESSGRTSDDRHGLTTLLELVCADGVARGADTLEDLTERSAHLGKEQFHRLNL